MQVLKQILGFKVQFGGEEHEGWLPDGASLPKPTPCETVELDIRIEATDGGYLLIWVGQNRRYCGDTWHETVQDAERQAELQFGITGRDWQTD